MAAEKEYRVKKFKNSDKDFWVSYLHYSLIDGKPTLVAGGIETVESLAAITKYLKTKKLI